MSRKSKLTQDFDHSKYVELTKDSRFKPGDLCWAKKEKLRAWPAKVLAPSDEELKSYPKSEEIFVFVNYFIVDEKKFVAESQVWDYLQGLKKFTRMKVNKTYEKAVKTIMEIGSNMSKSSSPECALNNVSCNNKSAKDNSAMEDNTEEHKVLNNDSEAVEENGTTATHDLHSKSLQHSDGELLNNEEISIEKESQVKSKDCNEKFDDNFVSTSQQNGTDHLPLAHTSDNSLSSVNLPVNEAVEGNLPEHEKASSNDGSEHLNGAESISEFEPEKNVSSELENSLTTACSEPKIQSKPKRFLKQPTSVIWDEQHQAVSSVLQNETTPENISKTRSRHVRTPAEILTHMLSKLDESTEQKYKAQEVKKHTKKHLKRKSELEKHEEIGKQAKVDVYEFQEENLEISEALSPHRPKKGEGDIVQTAELTSPGSKLYQHKSPKTASTNHRVSQSPQKVTQSSSKSIGSPRNQNVVDNVRSDSSSQVLTEPISRNSEKNSLDDICDIPEVMLKGMPSIVTEKFIGDGVLKSAKFVAPKTSFGFIGLGNLGRKLVSKLLSTGHSLMIWNRNRVKCYEFLEKGATMAHRPADVVSDCEVIFCCLSDANAVKEVLYHDSEVLDVLKCGKGFVNLTTMDYKSALDVKDIIEYTGASYLESPISNYKKQQKRNEEPENAYMSVTAGDPEVLNKCLTCLGSFSSRIYYLGAVPKATNMVLALNSLVGSVSASFAQGFALAKQVGLSFDDLYKLLTITGLLTPSLYASIKDICQNKEDNHMPPLVYSKSLSAVLDHSTDFPLPVLAAAKEAFVGNHLRKYT